MPDPVPLDAAAGAIVGLYEHSDEQHRLLYDLGPLEEARMQELLLRFLPPAAVRICDVGGAAGAYTFWMASHGHKITLIDLVPLHIEQAMQRQKDADPEKRVIALVGDARRLPFPDDSFDALLIHGPMYHLTNKDDRRIALAEAYRVLKPNGRLLVVGITRYASTIYGLTSGERRNSMRW
jgi:ubiquinone/menaquinone biosynthesis C-methylase UbiE